MNELLTNDIIGESPSEIDKRQKIYHPLIENDSTTELRDDKITNISNMGQSYNFLQESKINLSKNCKKIPENWLVFEILGIAKYQGSDQLEWLPGLFFEPESRP